MTATTQERLARAALSRLAEPGDLSVARVVRDLGAVDAVEHLRMRASGPDGSDVSVRDQALNPARDLEQADRLGIRFIVPGDQEWPEQLADLDECDPVQDQGGQPFGLWVKGPLRFDESDLSVAVVGSRSATSYGTNVAGAIGATLAATGLTVISGAAFGIDQAGHRGALAAEGPTVAVLACGVDRAYPQAHRELIDYIASHGAVVAELPPGCSPTRFRFLARNRVIAALTAGTVVVEAAVRSGALNTANWADRLSRQVMGVPGPVTSAQSQGVHQLIRGGAALVTNGAEVLELVGAAGSHVLEQPRAEARPRDRLRAKDARVLEAVPVVTPARIDSIARTAGFDVFTVQRALLRLQQDRFVQSVGPGWRLGPAARGA